MNFNWDEMNVRATTTEDENDQICMTFETKDGEYVNIHLDRSDAKWLIKKLKASLELTK